MNEQFKITDKDNKQYLKEKEYLKEVWFILATYYNYLFNQGLSKDEIFNEITDDTKETLKFHIELDKNDKVKAKRPTKRLHMSHLHYI